MAAPRGNSFWKLRAKHGRDKIFESPELLWECACEYFEWCDKNPLKEQKAFGGKNRIRKTDMKLMRAYTLRGLCLYLGCSSSYFRAFKSNNKNDDEGFLTVIEQIEETIYVQKFEGAAAGLLNANIIARDLGLKDQQEVETIDKSKQYTKEELEEEIQRIRKIRSE